MAALGGGIYQGSEQQSAQREGIRRQQAAQQQAQAAAVSERRRAEMSERALNRQSPDIGSLLAFEQQFPAFGGKPVPAIDQSRLKLGRTEVLGAP